MKQFITLTTTVLLVLFAVTIQGRSYQTASLATCPDPAYNNGISHKIYTLIDKMHSLLAPIDPLGPLPTVNFTMNNAYVRLKGSLEETIIRHLSEFTICEVTVEIGLRQSFHLDLRLDNFRADGTYGLSGVYALIFPIFGSGIYTLDVYNASIGGSADISYNIITSHAQIHNLELDIFFEDLKLYLECILGCGDMADYVNSHISDLATTLFNNIWEKIDPILTEKLENGINAFLKETKLPPKYSNVELPRSTFQLPLRKLLKNFQHP